MNCKHQFEQSSVQPGDEICDKIMLSDVTPGHEKKAKQIVPVENCPSKKCTQIPP